MYSSPPVRAPKLQLAVAQPSIGGCWNPPKKKDTPHAKTKKKPQQDSRRGCNHNKIKSYTHGEKAMAPHSSTLASKIPWTEEPGRL